MEKLRIVIADDQVLFRENLKTVIELRIPHAEVVGVAGNGAEAAELVAAKAPDLLLLDMNMPVMDGVSCIKLLHERKWQVKIIVLTTFDDDNYLFEALQYGAVGYLLKDIEPEALTNAIVQVAEGGTLMSPQVTTKLVDEVKRRRMADPAIRKDDFSKLTQRELEVFRYIGLGCDNKEIAAQLHIAEGTVRNHVSNIYEKLELRDRAHAIRYAILSGLV